MQPTTAEEVEPEEQSTDTLASIADALTTTVAPTTTPTPTQLVSSPSELLLSLGSRPHTLSSNQGQSDGVGVELEWIILTIATIFRYVCICVLVYTVYTI